MQGSGGVITHPLPAGRRALVSRRSKGAEGLTVPYDLSLLFPVLFLVGVGLVMIYSASSALALDRFGNEFHYLKRQVIFSLIGIVTLVVFRRLPLKFFRMLVYPLLGISLMLLVGVFIPGLGLEVKKASRWISLGALTFQPSEVARFAIVLYLAYSLSKKQDRIRIFSIGIAPHVAVLGVFMLLLAFQPDFGSMVILSAVTWVMLFTGGARIIHLLSPLTVLLPALYCYMVSADYRLARLYSFLNPWKYSSNEGFQMINSLMGFGSGGVLGGGIGKGYLKLFYLPEPHTDFIFAVVGEELGLIGVLIILVLYSIIVWRGLLIACRARNTFNQLLAVGLTTAIGLQILVNISVALGLLPTKGLTLPFMSYGGTSLLINMASVGILLNISASGGKQ